MSFRRQHVIDRFIGGFFCAECRVAVELDGEIHGDRVERDAARTRILEARGIRVLRFTNFEVLHDRSRVLRRIAAAGSSGGAIR